MCGIAGFTGAPDEGLLRRMNDAQRHRGPDDEGSHVDVELGVSLAMRRLAIIDVADGHQPMCDDDRAVWLVFNGEIFNAPELRRELERDGRRFHTGHSDTEVVLQLYLEHGPSMVERLEGLFAFVIVDRRERRLFAAVDRFGIKPLYWSTAGARFSFASELKSLRVLPWTGSDLDRQALFHFLSLQAVPAPHSILAGVRRLEPAQSLTLDLESSSLALRTYWTPDSTLIARGMERVDAVALVRSELQRAVDAWSLSDVPVACSLSGGLDSAAVTGAMAVGWAGSSPIQTYTLGYDDAPGIDERALAREVARRWGTDHHEIVMTADDMLEDLPAMLHHLDEPYGGGLPSWPVFKAMGGEVKVAMTGVGGDELFGNYGKWRAFMPWALRYPRALPAQLRARASRWPAGARYRPLYLSDADKRALVVRPEVADGLVATEEMIERRWRSMARLDPRDRIALVDFGQQLPNEFLSMVDRFSMAHSVEARTPFLDHRLVEAVLSIPPAVRTRPDDLKGLLRDAVADLLPPALLQAPKQGFVMPVSRWLRTRLRDDVRRVLEPAALDRGGLFRTELWSRYVEPHLDGRAEHPMVVWTTYLFQRWHEASTG